MRSLPELVVMAESRMPTLVSASMASPRKPSQPERSTVKVELPVTLVLARPLLRTNTSSTPMALAPIVIV